MFSRGNHVPDPCLLPSIWQLAYQVSRFDDLYCVIRSQNWTTILAERYRL